MKPNPDRKDPTFKGLLKTPSPLTKAAPGTRDLVKNSEGYGPRDGVS